MLEKDSKFQKRLHDLSCQIADEPKGIARMGIARMVAWLYGRMVVIWSCGLFNRSEVNGVALLCFLCFVQLSK